MITTFLLPLVLLAGHQDAVPFKRTYAQSEKSTYNVTMQVEAFGLSIDSDIEQSVGKVLDGGKTELTLKTVRYVTTGETRPSVAPGPLTSKVGAFNMLESLKLTMGGTDFLYLFLGAAGMTADKSVRTGEEYALSWEAKGGGESLKGTGKVLDISKADGTFRAQIDLAFSVQGQQAGTFSFTSVYTLSDASLKSSTGALTVAGMSQAIKIVRK